MAEVSAVITPKGMAKLTAIAEAMRSQVQISLTREMLRVREVAASIAPDEQEEAALVSRGEISGSDPYSGLIVGTPEGGRFLRGEGQVSLREAIATDPIDEFAETSLERTYFQVSTGRAERINPRTGFYWMTRRRGRQGPSLPFNGAYLQAMEFGGMVWIVVPRDRGIFLEPEPGFRAAEMTKTLPPRRMYTDAIAGERLTVATNVASDVRRAVRAVGLDSIA